jgi:hypothetical protein
LRTAWSLAAVIFFWSLLGAELLVIGLFAPREPWLWMLLLSLPILGWYMEQENRQLQRITATFLDELARQHHLVPVDPKQSQGL